LVFRGLVRRYGCGVLTRTRFADLVTLETPLHLALGMFDGVHAGHQAVIAAAISAARQHGGLGGVLTFDPHPIRVIAPEKAPTALLATLEHKARIIDDLGADLFVPLPFDRELADLDAAEFLDRLLAARVRTIAVGEDWRFGRGRSGDVAFLRAQARRRNYELIAVPPVMFDGDRISSTRVRQAIRDGNLADAARMLGRPPAVTGAVVEGRKLGRQLGFPTANIAFGAVQLPPDGVWAVRARAAAGPPVAGVANLGVRPTVGGSQRVLEVHLLDFAGDLYGRELEISFIAFIRGERKMASLEALREQIELDAKAAARILAAAAKSP
jgi:riboflavin kinase/FMN adenylyltransferase